MSVEDKLAFLRVVSGPVAMSIAAIAAALFGNWFAWALAVVASIGWYANIVDALERHANDVQACLDMVDEAHGLAERNIGLCKWYAAELDIELRASAAVREHFYERGRTDACDRVNTLLAEQGSPLRVTCPRSNEQVN